MQYHTEMGQRWSDWKTQMELRPRLDWHEGSMATICYVGLLSEMESRQPDRQVTLKWAYYCDWLCLRAVWLAHLSGSEDATSLLFRPVPLNWYCWQPCFVKWRHSSTAGRTACSGTDWPARDPWRCSWHWRAVCLMLACGHWWPWLNRWLDWSPSCCLQKCCRSSGVC